ncbi:MAG: choice-of-anchor D domain-containing protein, partial [Deltaproteobacteria bacterium]
MKRLFVPYLLPALMLFAGCGGSAVGGDGGVITCVNDADCAVGQSCIQGVCTTLDGGSGCSSDEDCPAGQSCIQGVCVLKEAADGGETGDGGDGADGLPAVPDISIEPEAIDFGAAPVGTAVEQKLVVANEGGAELTLFSVTLEQGSSTEFGVVPSGNLGRMLGPGETFELLVTYTPTDGVADSGALLVSSDDPDEALVRVPLSSSYKGSSEITATADPAALGPDLAVLDFGSVSVGQRASRELFVKNTGRGSAMLAVQQVRVDPEGSLDFTVQSVLPDLPAWLSPYMGTCTSDSDCPQDYTCLSGACTDSSGGVYDQVKVTVGFTPQRAGEIVEALVVVNDEDDAAGDGLEQPLRIVLRGEGTQPAIAFEPARVDFGRIFAGQSASAELLISNPGSELLAIQSIDLQDRAVFGVDTTGTAFNLAPGEQTQVVLSYTPTQPGIDGTVLVVASNAPGSPHEVQLTAEAVAPPVIAVSPESIDFGQVQLTQLASASLVVTNTGPNPLEITSISMESSSSPSFSVLQGALPPIDGGGQGRIDVVFAPQDAGVHQGTVEIRSNDPALPLLTVSLAGTGVDPELAVAPASIDFGDIYVGYRAGPVVLTVSNQGSGTLDVLAIGTGTGTEADFQIQALPVLPASLSPGQSVSCEVYFTPLGTGPRAGSIQIVSSDVDNPLLEVPLSGNGTNCPAGWWDADGDPSNGCEYRCDLTNGGVEDCDGVDNDCDQQTDEDL